MVPFVVGLIVGASIVTLVVIVVGPSRKVRAERGLPRDVESKLLLGEDPDQPTIPPPPRVERPQQYSPSDIAALQKLGQEQEKRRRKR